MYSDFFLLLCRSLTSFFIVNWSFMRSGVYLIHPSFCKWRNCISRHNVVVSKGIAVQLFDVDVFTTAFYHFGGSALKFSVFLGVYRSLNCVLKQQEFFISCSCALLLQMQKKNLVWDIIFASICFCDTANTCRRFVYVIIFISNHSFV